MYQNMHYNSGKKLSPSKEEYLKAIFCLSQKEQAVRSIDLAAYLGVSKPSVNKAITILQEKGLAVKPLGGEIHLTDEGRAQGKMITAKYQLLKQFLVTCCKVNEETASKDACKIEHFISEETALALEKYCIDKYTIK